MNELTNEIKEDDFNKELLESLKEAEDIINNPDKYKGYNNIDELKKDLLSDE